MLQHFAGVDLWYHLRYHMWYRPAMHVEVGEPVRSSVCVPDCLNVCMSVCLSACPSVCLSVCLLAWMYICLSACVPAWMYVCLPACLPAWMYVCPSAYLYVYISLSGCKYVRISKFTRMYACMHVCTYA